VGFVLESVDGSDVLEVAEHEDDAATHRLELLAVVRGLEALDQPSRVTLVTSSEYVRRGLRFGIQQWREDGWRWEFFGRMVRSRMPISGNVLIGQREFTTCAAGLGVGFGHPAGPVPRRRTAVSRRRDPPYTLLPDCVGDLRHRASGSGRRLPQSRPGSTSAVGRLSCAPNRMRHFVVGTGQDRDVSAHEYVIIRHVRPPRRQHIRVRAGKPVHCQPPAVNYIFGAVRPR